MLKVMYVTSLNKRLFEHPAQKLVSSVTKFDCVPLTIYHENKYEIDKFNRSIDFKNLPSNVYKKDLWEILGYKTWVESFVDSKHSPFNIESLHSNLVKKRQAKFWFRKVLSIAHAVLNNDVDYVIWCDGDAEFVKPIDNKFWEFVHNFDVTCIWRSNLHIESGFVVYRINDKVKRMMREYLGYYVSGDVFKQPRWCDGSVLTYVLDNHPSLSIGKFKNSEYNGGDTSPFHYSEYFYHSKLPFKEVRDKE